MPLAVMAWTIRRACTGSTRMPALATASAEGNSIRFAARVVSDDPDLPPFSSEAIVSVVTLTPDKGSSDAADSLENQGSFQSLRVPHKARPPSKPSVKNVGSWLLRKPIQPGFTKGVNC